MRNVSDNIQNAEERAESGLKNPAFARQTAAGQANHGETMAVVNWLLGGYRRYPFPGPDESAPALKVTLLAASVQRGDHITYGRSEVRS